MSKLTDLIDKHKDSDTSLDGGTAFECSGGNYDDAYYFGKEHGYAKALQDVAELLHDHDAEVERALIKHQTNGGELL